MTGESPFRYNLGDKVKDVVTGFEGVIVARVEWFNGCIRYNVQPQALHHENKTPLSSEHFDEQQLELVAERVAIPTHTRERRPVESTPTRRTRTGGGDRNDPKRTDNITR